MDSKKSGIYPLDGKKFRYNFTDGVVEYIEKADAETLADEADWKQRHNGQPLYGIGADGYMVIDTVGLSSENWRDREARDAYLRGWIEDLYYEGEQLAADFVKYELPYLTGADR